MRGEHHGLWERGRDGLRPQPSDSVCRQNRGPGGLSRICLRGREGGSTSTFKLQECPKRTESLSRQTCEHPQTPELRAQDVQPRGASAHLPRRAHRPRARVPGDQSPCPSVGPIRPLEAVTCQVVGPGVGTERTDSGCCPQEHLDLQGQRGPGGSGERLGPGSQEQGRGCPRPPSGRTEDPTPPRGAPGRPCPPPPVPPLQAEGRPEAAGGGRLWEAPPRGWQGSGPSGTAGGPGPTSCPKRGQHTAPPLPPPPPGRACVPPLSSGTSSPTGSRPDCPHNSLKPPISHQPPRRSPQSPAHGTRPPVCGEQTRRRSAGTVAPQSGGWVAGRGQPDTPT